MRNRQYCLSRASAFSYSEVVFNHLEQRFNAVDIEGKNDVPADVHLLDDEVYFRHQHERAVIVGSRAKQVSERVLFVLRKLEMEGILKQVSQRPDQCINYNIICLFFRKIQSLFFQNLSLLYMRIGK